MLVSFADRLHENGLVTMIGRYAIAVRARAVPVALTLAALCLLPADAMAAPGKQHGTWLTDQGKAKIKLWECGADGLCSRIVWLKDPLDERGRPWRDQLNADPVLRRRQVVGIDVLKGTKKVGDRTWQGQIYDPEKGKYFYLKHLVIGSNGIVEIRGCKLSGWPCRTKYWTQTKPVQVPKPKLKVAKPKPAPKPKAAAKPKPAPKPTQSVAVTKPPAPKPAPTPAPAQARPAPPAPAAAAAPPPPPVQRQAAAVPTRRPAAPAPATRAPQPAPTAAAPSPATTSALARPMTAAPPTAATGYLVQVTAGPNQNAALKSFGELQRRFPSLLGGYSPNIQKVDLGQKGVWYRVRVGPLGQRTAAVSFCERLKAAGGDCLVRRN